MQKDFQEILKGYQVFRQKYAEGDNSIMSYLAYYGQQPESMVVACCDSRVDPSLILQCNPGDLFIVRNVANIVPPFEKDDAHHGTSAALEFGVCFLNVKHLIILGHSQCGGIQARLNSAALGHNDFITNWVSLIKKPYAPELQADEFAKLALIESGEHCLTFPWVKEKVDKNELTIHLWFFDIQSGQIFTYKKESDVFEALS